MSSFYFNKEAKKEIEQLYHRKLNELPIRYEFMNIETTFGDTNIIITGPKEKSPLVLLHGENSCAPLAIESMIELTQNFRIYAIDILGQPNLSEEFRPNKNDDTYGKWMYEILSRLGLRKTFLVGISLGGFVALKLLTFDESRISKTFLVAPAGIVNWSSVQAFIEMFPGTNPGNKQEEMENTNRFFEKIFTVRNQFAEACLSKIVLNYKLDFSPIPLITREEAQKIKTPLHIFAAENDQLFPGKEMLKIASEIFQDNQNLYLLKNSKHIPSQKDFQFITERIKNEL